MMGLPDVASADGDVRYVPAEKHAMSFEALAHESRYVWAQPYVEGRRVLDFGCGSGFGSARLASVAAAVDGIDYSPSAVAFASERFGRPEVSFVAGDVTDPDVIGRLRPPYDTLVSFDVIEHVDRYLDFLSNAVALLSDDGTALIGCPNRLQTFALNQAWNPFHMQEFTPAQLRGLLQLFFGSVQVWSQEMATPELHARIRHQRTGSNWRNAARSMLPPGAKAVIKRALGRRGAGDTFSATDVQFLEEPGEEALGAAFGLIAVCRQPRRDHPLV